MAGRPSIQFYFGDWKKNKKLRFCSWGARGVWIEVMGLMHDSEETQEYGVIRKPIKKISVAVGAPLKFIKELTDNGVMRGCENGLCEPFVYRPKHGRMEGPAVTLIEAQQGPIWYSARMVVDEYVRLNRSQSGRFGDGFGDAPKGGIGDDFGDSPNRAPNPDKGDGASTSSSSSSSKIGSSSTSAQLEEVPAEHARVVVQSCIALKKLGMHDVHPVRPELIELAARGATVEQMALTAAELALKKAGMLHDSDLHPELLELFASGATAQQMCLTPAQHTTLKASAPKLAYLAATLKGRADEQQSQGENYGNGSTGGVRGGYGAASARRGPPESAAARAERKRHEGDERDQAAGTAHAG